MDPTNAQSCLGKTLTVTKPAKITTKGGLSIRIYSVRGQYFEYK